MKCEDNVNHPSHYAEGRKYEPIDVIEDWELDFCLGNAVKYISRAGRKSDELEDLKKGPLVSRPQDLQPGGGSLDRCYSRSELSQVWSRTESHVWCRDRLSLLCGYVNHTRKREL